MKFALLSTVFVLSVGGVAQAATITNGSFESGVVSGNFTTLGAGSSALTGWTIGGGGVDHIGTFWQSSDQSQSLDLSAGAAGSISQELTGLTDGVAYVVGFDLSGNSGGGDDVKTIQVSAEGSSASYEFDTAAQANSTANMKWQATEFTFTAVGTTADLTFASLETNAFGPALDNVTISVAPIPLPAGAVLLLGGLAGLGALRRRSV